MTRYARISFTLFTVLLASCAGYKKNIMFRTDGPQLQQQVIAAERNYVIQKNDLLELDVFLNNGERLIDPASDVSPENNQQVERERLTYLVDQNGIARFPLINDVKLEGLTIRQAEDMLRQAYSASYLKTFVNLRFANKRVIVLGTPFGTVLPLANENMRLSEVLALSKAITNDANATNIRLIRKDKVFVADFSTFDNYLKSDMIVEAGDIVYIEPIRRPVSEGFRDYAPIISIITSVGTLVFLIIQSTN